jgi:hypothetical protein
MATASASDVSIAWTVATRPEPGSSFRWPPLLRAKRPIPAGRKLARSSRIKMAMVSSKASSTALT